MECTQHNITNTNTVYRDLVNLDANVEYDLSCNSQATVYVIEYPPPDPTRPQQFLRSFTNRKHVTWFSMWRMVATGPRTAREFGLVFFAQFLSSVLFDYDGEVKTT